MTHPTRRAFIASTTNATAALLLSPYVRRPAAYDLVIRNGNVFDGTGAAPVASDVAISGGRIVAIGRRLDERGSEEVDARGMAVAPGFIDIHSHGDSGLSRDPRAESVIRQGVTTIVVGQDGSSGGTRGDQGFAEMMAGYERSKSAVNVAAMIGLGSVRGTVVGDRDRPATPDEVTRMTAIVDRAIQQGACGASSGLEYTPGAFASLDELIALCKPLAARRLPYATHMRNEDDRLLDAIDESIAVTRGAGCPLEISHLKTQGPRNWSKLDTVFARIDAARKAGVDVTFDRYPYVAYQTGLSNLFPVWSRDGSDADFLARLADSATAPRIRQETLAKVELIGGWDNVMVTSVRAPEDRNVEGKRIGTFASSIAADPYVYTTELLRRNNGNVGMVGFAMSEDNLERILAHPLGMVCSDGGAFAVDARRGSPHPRGLGTFPRVLGRYVRERKALALQQAIHKMSGQPAVRLRLADRGRIATGYAADVVVFDPATVTDKATFEEPYQYPVGIGVVIVNGTIALRDGQRTPTGTGKALRPAARG